MPTFNIYIPLVFLFIIITFLSLQTEAAYLPALYYSCPPNTSTYSPNSTYQSNLNLVLSSLVTNADNDNRFYNFTAGGDSQDTVYGLFLCRGDVAADICQYCVEKAKADILSQPYCPNERTAIIWYELCMLRYGDQSFFSVMEDLPIMTQCNPENVTEQSRFYQTVNDTMDNISTRAASDQSGKKFATGEANFTAPYNTIYNLVQCTPDISAADCNRCLQTAVASLPHLCSGTMGRKVFLPSCNIRYELFAFYSISAPAPTPPELISPPSSSNTAAGPSWSITRAQGGGKAPWLAIGTSVSAFIVIVLLGSCIFYKWRRKRAEGNSNENQEIQLLEYFEGGRLADNYSNENLQGDEHAKSQDFPLIRLGLINAATKNFSEENKLGEGGFGPVYKVIVVITLMLILVCRKDGKVE